MSREPMTTTRQMRSEADELEKVRRDTLEQAQREVHAAVTQTRDIPGYSDPTDYTQPSLQVSFNVPGRRVAEILQAEVSKDRIAHIEDAAIEAIVLRYFVEQASKPVEIDLGPYEDRVRNLTHSGSALSPPSVLPPLAQSWPPQLTGEQQ